MKHLRANATVVRDGLLKDRAACTPDGDVTGWDPEAILTEHPHEVTCQRCVMRDPRAKPVGGEANQTFAVEARDKGEDWRPPMMTGAPRAARTRMIMEAGMMAQGGWEVVGFARQEITMEDPETGRRTEIRMRKVSG